VFSDAVSITAISTITQKASVRGAFCCILECKAGIETASSVFCEAKGTQNREDLRSKCPKRSFGFRHLHQKEKVAKAAFSFFTFH